VSREEFWQSIFIAAIRAGRDAGHAVEAADYAIKKFDERSQHGVPFMHKEGK
jgi:hypothetical protein